MQTGRRPPHQIPQQPHLALTLIQLYSFLAFCMCHLIPELTAKPQTLTSALDLTNSEVHQKAEYLSISHSVNKILSSLNFFTCGSSSLWTHYSSRVPWPKTWKCWLSSWLLHNQLKSGSGRAAGHCVEDISGIEQKHNPDFTALSPPGLHLKILSQME